MVKFKKKALLVLFTCSVVVSSGCGTMKPQQIGDPEGHGNHNIVTIHPNTANLSKFATQMIESMIRHGHLSKLNGGNRCAIYLDKRNLRDKSGLMINMDKVMTKITAALNRSGMVMVKTGTPKITKSQKGPWAITGYLDKSTTRVDEDSMLYEYSFVLKLEDLKEKYEPWQEVKEMVVHGSYKGF
jgi:hypothetical protein